MNKFKTPGRKLEARDEKVSEEIRISTSARLSCLPGILKLSRVSKFEFSISQILSLVFFMLVLSPSRAAAHLVTTGMGPVYDGIGHLMLTPEDLVPVIALALFAGLRGAAAGRRTMFLLPASWFIGGCIGSAFGSIPSFPLAALSFLVVGGLVASDLRVSPEAATALAVAIGLVHGFLNGAALKEGPGILGEVGIMTMLFIFVALGSALVVWMKKPWTRIAVRVVGSWVFASGLLMLGWMAKGQT
jgi:urease accessory protein